MTKKPNVCGGFFKEAVLLSIVEVYLLKRRNSVYFEKVVVRKNQKIIHLNKLKELLQNKYQQHDKLNDEIVKCLMGESNFTEERLNIVIEKTEKDITELRSHIELTEKEIDQSKIKMTNIEHLKTEFIEWETKYRNADISSKK